MPASTEHLLDRVMRWGLVALALLGAGATVHAYFQIARAVVLALAGGAS